MSSILYWKKKGKKMIIISYSFEKMYKSNKETSSSQKYILYLYIEKLYTLQ